MDDLINDFSEVRECDYKDEHYSVRDNGAVMRHPRKDKKLRPNDNVWTFGKRDKRTGYMKLGKHRVHIIVANAFLGEHDSQAYVVDHIDTNHCNNRVENLRWCTPLENALNNPITRKKIEMLCGGDIQKFIDDPSCLRTEGPYAQDVSWMRTVSREEAKTAYANYLRWAQTPSPQRTVPPVDNDNILPRDKEWMYKKQQWHSLYRQAHSAEEVEDMFEKMRNMLEDNNDSNDSNENETEPFVEYLLEPTEDNADLEAYFAKLVSGVAISRTQYGYCKVIKAMIAKDKSTIGVAVTMPSTPPRPPWSNWIGPFGAYKIYCENGKFVHDFLHTCFDENVALQRMTEAVGEKWTAPDNTDN